MEICSYTFVDPQAVPLNQLQFGFDLKLIENVKWPTKLIENVKWPNKLIEKLTLHANQSFQVFSSLVTSPKKKVQQSALSFRPSGPARQQSYLNQVC